MCGFWSKPATPTVDKSCAAQKTSQYNAELDAYYVVQHAGYIHHSAYAHTLYACHVCVHAYGMPDVHTL